MNGQEKGRRARGGEGGELGKGTWGKSAENARGAWEVKLLCDRNWELILSVSLYAMEFFLAYIVTIGVKMPIG